MIFKFRIVSDEGKNFKREINIDGSATFMDLKNAICESVNYDKNQMCSFFICSDDWEKEKEITFEDMGADADQEVWLMDECVLGDQLDDEGQKLLFTFDYMTDRSMYMELTDIITGRTLKDPICTLSVGTPPEQNVDLYEFTENLDKASEKKKNVESTSIDDISEDEFYGSDAYNEEEFDPQGFSEISPY